MKRAFKILWPMRFPNGTRVGRGRLITTDPVLIEQLEASKGAQAVGMEAPKPAESKVRDGTGHVVATVIAEKEDDGAVRVGDLGARDPEPTWDWMTKAELRSWLENAGAEDVPNTAANKETLIEACKLAHFEGLRAASVDTK